MSYEEFRKRIDTARDILVGAVPSPAGQIDQITYALMYKFMSDIDDKSAKFGGKRTYFAGDYEKYSWHNLMSPTMEAYDRLELYRQAIQGMSKNPNIPELFREIYQNAFLPFNTPSVLTLFLSEISKFEHGDSDDIGDAYEYLLSITGAQGDVGQFRTPRHIIKFITEAVNPTKDDSVLDPAVGTAGFLIAAYKHVKLQHDGVDEAGNSNDEKELTTAERDKMHQSYHGFDIDPTMVRTAKVNMYLHGFTQPDIRNHDTLSSDDYWERRYDVILANPPFMTPKGGIQPHKKFSINANRAEVLFVDYIANHLNPVSGRAGVIVPEGIIFQTSKAYKELRKNLVENCLYAVVSLPAGVFQPYSGVKTSILLFDRKLAKERNDILFVKIENDGFSLNAQRTAIDGNQLTEALDIINEYKLDTTTIKSEIAHTVDRSAIASDGDYNLNGDRYQEYDDIIDTKYNIVTLGELEDRGEISFLRGQGLSKKDISENGKYKCIHYGEIYTIYQPKIENIVSRTEISGRVLSQKGDVLVPATTTADAMGIAVARALSEDGVVLGGDINIIRTNDRYVLSVYLAYIISNSPVKNQLATYAKGVNILHLSNSDLRKLKIPLPPLEIQKKIVEEIENKQQAIDHAKAIIKNLERERSYFDQSLKSIGSVDYKHLGDLCEVLDKLRKPITKSDRISGEYPYYGATGILDYVNDYIFGERLVLIGEDGAKWGSGDETAFIAEGKYWVNNHAHVIRPNGKAIIDDFLVSYLNSIDLSPYTTGVTVPKLNQEKLKSIKVPVPPIEIQEQFVHTAKQEQEIIKANKKLINLYQRKIQNRLAEVWGE